VSELERELVALGGELAVPEAPDLIPRVLAELGPSRGRAAPRRRLILALAAMLAAALLATLAIPDARSALARFFHIGAERIEIVDELPEVAPAETELELTLGRPVTLEEARELAGFELLELDEEPDSVYVGERGTVWFLYGRPDAVQLLVAQTPNLGIDEPALFKKLAAEGTSVSEVDVRGQQGFFLSGEPHLIFLLDENGDVVGDSARLAQEVLVWAEDGRTIRLEGELTEQEALRVAEALSVRSRG
jgi:hypothetical protein